MSSASPKRGDVFAARLGGGEGSKQLGTRPVVIVSNDLFNDAMPMVTIVPITSVKTGSVLRPSEAPIPKGGSGLRVESKAMCHQVRTIAVSRLGKKIGALDVASLVELSRLLRLHLGL